jgi:hypothetical protein
VAGPGGNAYTNFYFGAATTANLTALGQLFSAIKALYPSYVTYTLPNSGDTISELNGKIIGGWAATPPAPVAGTASTGGPSLAGFLIDWKTTTVIDGHRPIGKTIIVPMSNLATDSQGRMSSATQTTVNAAASAFLSASAGFAIWHRPVYDRKVNPPVLTRPGDIVAVTSGTCNPNPTVLRSRRS